MSRSKRRPCIDKIFIFLLLPFFMVILAACSDNTSDDGDGDAETGESAVQSVTATAGEESLVANGSSETWIRAEVLDDDGAPVSGIEVVFETNFGTLSESEKNTGADGIAEVILTSDTQILTAQVTAGIPDEALSSQVEVEFVPGPPVNENSSITVQPSTIPADGESTADVTATLADAQGNPVLNGTEVELYASLGTITTDNPTTTDSGRATFTVQAPSSTGTAELSLWGYPDIDSAELQFGSVAVGEPASVMIESVAHKEIAVTGVGKNDSTSVSVRVVDATGGTVADDDISLRVSFLARPEGGEFISGENPDGDSVSDGEEIEIGTDSGEAIFNLRSGVLPGAMEIRIEVLDAGSPMTPAVVTVTPQVSIASGPPHTIALSAPRNDAVVDLNTGEDSGIPQTPGFYSRKAGLIVTDRYGNAVPDGTVINLGMVDSVISAGTTGETIDGDAVLSETDPSATFSSDSVVRNNVEREIEPNDRVLLFNVQAEDKSRFVDQPFGDATNLNVTKSYKNDKDSIEYVVGASLLGGALYGIDEDGATKGTVKTIEGLGQIRLVYPANPNTIHVGYAPGIDTRHEPTGSARVVTVFTTSDDSATLVDEGTLNFSSIAPWTFTASPDSITLPQGDDTDILLTLEDGGDEIPLFVEISASVYSEDGVELTVTEDTTDVNGTFTSNVAVDSGSGSATITYSAGDAEVEVDVTVPAGE